MTVVNTPGAPATVPPTSPSGQRQLRRSRSDRVLFGVCGGLGRYLDIDPVVLRILTVVLIFAGVGIPAYLVAWLVIPEAEGDLEDAPTDAETRQRTAIVLGAALIGLGALLLLRGMVPWFDTELFWPLLLVAGGALLVISARR